MWAWATLRVTPSRSFKEMLYLLGRFLCKPFKQEGFGHTAKEAATCQTFLSAPNSSASEGRAERAPDRSIELYPRLRRPVYGHEKTWVCVFF